MLSITLFFFGPLEIMLSSPAEFWFSISDVILLIAGSTIVCFAISMFVMFIAARFGEKILNIVISLIAAIGVAFYIQGNWTFVNYGEMDGTAINWGNYHNWAIIDSFIWIIIIVVLVFLINCKSKYSKIYSSKTQFTFIRVIKSAIDLEWLSGPQIELETRFKHILKIWNARILVLNDELAAEHGLVKDSITA